METKTLAERLERLRQAVQESKDARKDALTAQALAPKGANPDAR